MNTSEFSFERMIQEITEKLSYLESLLFANDYNTFSSQIVELTEQLLVLIEEISSTRKIEEKHLEQFNHTLIKMMNFIEHKDYVELFDILHFELSDILKRLI